MQSAKLKVEQRQFVDFGGEQRELPAGESSTETPEKDDTLGNVDSAGTNPSNFPCALLELILTSELGKIDQQSGPGPTSPARLLEAANASETLNVSADKGCCKMTRTGGGADFLGTLVRSHDERRCLSWERPRVANHRVYLSIRRKEGKIGTLGSGPPLDSEAATACRCASRPCKADRVHQWCDRLMLVELTVSCSNVQIKD